MYNYVAKTWKGDDIVVESVERYTMSLGKRYVKDALATSTDTQ